MTFEQEKELIILIFSQLTLLIVACIHAWLSHNRYLAKRQDHRRIEDELRELNGKHHKGDDHE